MQRVVPSRSDAPALIVMAVMFLSLGLFAIVRPEALRAAMDNFANAWKQDSWHLYKMSNSAIRLIVGGIGILGAVLFVYIACIALSRELTKKSVALVGGRQVSSDRSHLPHMACKKELSAPLRQVSAHHDEVGPQ